MQSLSKLTDKQYLLSGTIVLQTSLQEIWMNSYGKLFEKSTLIFKREPANICSDRKGKFSLAGMSRRYNMCRMMIWFGLKYV